MNVNVDNHNSFIDLVSLAATTRRLHAPSSELEGIRTAFSLGMQSNLSHKSGEFGSTSRLSNMQVKLLNTAVASFMNEFGEKTDNIATSDMEVQKISPSKTNNLASSTEEKFLKALYFILTDNLKLLENALDIVEDEYCRIKLYTSISSNRIFWVVPGSGRGKDYKEYVCIDEYCSCASYYEQAKATVDSVVCKHTLAVKIASVLQRYTSTPVSDDIFISLLTNQFSTDSKTNDIITFNPPSNFPRL